MVAKLKTLLAPSPLLTDPRQRLQAQLLMALLLVMTLGAAFLLPLYWLGEPGFVRWDNSSFVVELVGLILLPFFYFLSRTVHYQRVAVGFIIFLEIMLFLEAIPEPEYGYGGEFNYLLVIILLTAFFINLRAAALLVFVNALGVIAFASLDSYMNLYDIRLDFITLASLIFLIVFRYQQMIFTQQQAQLSASESRYRQLMEFNPDPIFVYNGDIFLYANQAASSLTGRNDIVGLPITEIAISPQQAAEVQALREQLSRKNLTQMEYAFTLNSGEKRWFDLRITPIEFQGAAARLSVIRDITERKQAEQRQFQLQLEQERVQILQEIVSEITHDLKTPLTVFESKLYMLEKTHPSETQQKHLDGLRAQAERLNSLIDQLNTMVRLEKSTLTLETTDLAAVLTSVAETFQSLAAEKQITLKTEIPPSLPYVLGDRNELQRAFTNLLSNALRYTPTGKHIYLVAHQQKNSAICEIKDTGIGIPAEALPHIFKRFYRTDQAREMSNNGSGLGLTIVKRIVEMHAATIEVESQEGEGTTFRVQFPVASAS